ncbi:MAG: hypothetical protein HS111_20015 [Kofleriaceae bacterium]|nr:hypothetical protein [Kofleriaceae bacterium]MCL4225222.1 hypothetical protein [Myxococcales bacterium]
MNTGLQELRETTGMYFVFAPVPISDPDIEARLWIDERKGLGEAALIENRNLGVIYIQLSLATSALCATAAAAIGAHVRPATVAEVQDEAARPDADGAALVKLGLLGASAPDDTTTRLVVEGIASADAVVRERAIYAAFLLKWPAFQQPLAAALEREEREDLRRMLEAAATVCDSAWPGARLRLGRRATALTGDRVAAQPPRLRAEAEEAQRRVHEQFTQLERQCDQFRPSQPVDDLILARFMRRRRTGMDVHHGRAVPGRPIRSHQEPQAPRRDRFTRGVDPSTGRPGHGMAYSDIAARLGGHQGSDVAVAIRQMQTGRHVTGVFGGDERSLAELRHLWFSTEIQRDQRNLVFSAMTHGLMARGDVDLAGAMNLHPAAQANAMSGLRQTS